MERVYSRIEAAYTDPSIIALVPAFLVFCDYALTFTLSGGAEAVLRYEFSPLVRYATAQGMMIPYLAGMMLFYYLVAYLALRLLGRTSLYPFGVALVVLVGITHLLGGLSWYVRDALFSAVVHGFSGVTILLALATFLLALRRGDGGKAAGGR
jgi:hypothetical protein